MPVTAQPPGPPRSGEIPRPWQVQAGQRYRTAGDPQHGMGSLGWHDSTVGVGGGIFVPGPGLTRVGVDYVYTRFSPGSTLRPAAGRSEPFGHVQEIRLSAQLFTPWSKEWNSQLFGVASSAFESGASPNDALSGASGVGITRRFSGLFSAGFGALILHHLESGAITFLPIALVDWRITDRLVLRSRQDVTLTYMLGAQQRLLVAGVASFFDRKQFRLDESGVAAGGVAEVGGYTVGGRLVWRPVPGLALEGTVEAPLAQKIRVHDRAGRKVVDARLRGGLLLSVSVRYRF